MLRQFMWIFLAALTLSSTSLTAKVDGTDYLDNGGSQSGISGQLLRHYCADSKQLGRFCYASVHRRKYLVVSPGLSDLDAFYIPLTQKFLNTHEPELYFEGTGLQHVDGEWYEIEVGFIISTSGSGDPHAPLAASLTTIKTDTESTVKLPPVTQDVLMRPAS